MVDISEYFKNYKPELQAILFDWGNTVMTVFPGQKGSMADWPQVQREKNIKELLDALVSQFKLAICSNAKDSNCELVKYALARVELNNYFDEVFTPRELNAFKPAPDFFISALKIMNAEPEHAVYIGDDYQNDIIAAKQIGLWTVWYNNHKLPIDSNAYPYHDFEVNDLMEILPFIRNNFI